MKYTAHILAFTLTAALLYLLPGCSSRQDGKKEGGKRGDQKPVVADAIVIAPGKLDNIIETNGTLRPGEEVELRSEVPGRIVSINFREGSHVNRGDLLVKIDDRELQAQLKKLQLDEKLAADDVSRKEKLLAINAVSREEYDKAVNQLEIIRANMDLSKTQITKTEIRAPFSGIVGLRQVSEGGYVSSSTLVSKLQQVDPMKLDFSVPEKYRNMLKSGTLVNFTVEGSEKTFSARVYAIEPSVDPTTHTILLRALCSNPGNTLMPGAFARIRILLETINQAITVPSEAVIPVIDGQKVMICRNGKVASQKVVTGIRNEQMIQIINGLQEGDTVFVSGLLVMKDEMKANPKVITYSFTGTGGAQ